MRTSDSIKNVSAALFQFQSKVVQPHKDETADTGKFKYEYISLPALKAHIKPLMEECGLVFVSCGLTSRIIHVETGEWIEGEFVCDVAGLDAQKCGAVGSYARRYNLSGLLDICAEEDDDAASAKPAQRQQAQPKTTAPKREQPQGTGATGNGGDGSEGPPPPDDESLKKVFAKVLLVTKKPGTKGDGSTYTRYGIKVDWPEVGERWLNTFSDTLGKVASEVKGTQQAILYSESQWNGKPQFDLEGFDR